MRNELSSIPLSSLCECLIINIDHSGNPGTHWTSLFVNNGSCFYFDPFGLRPPHEIVQYMDNKPDVVDRYFNTFPIQSPDEVTCGHYCIYMLIKLSNWNEKFYMILDELYKIKQ